VDKSALIIGISQKLDSSFKLKFPAISSLLFSFACCISMLPSVFEKSK